MWIDTHQTVGGFAIHQLAPAGRPCHVRSARTRLCDGSLFAAIGPYSPDFIVSTSVGIKRNFLSVWRPSRVTVLESIVRQLPKVPPIGPHDCDIFLLAALPKSYPLTIRRWGRHRGQLVSASD